MSRADPEHLIRMREGGYYAEHSQGAKAVVDASAPMALWAATRVPLDPAERRPIVVVDFGAADGGNSADLVRAVLACLRERSAKRAIQIVYTDLPRNDYSALFSWLHGGAPGASYLDEHPGVFALASGTSFYRQLLPDGSVDLAFSATAMHWLSRKPCDIPDHVHVVGAPLAERAEFAAQAAADWRTILVHRARELAPGGYFVAANLCIDEGGRYVGSTSGARVLDTFAELWRSMYGDGKIGEHEYRSATLPQYYRTVAELQAPLLDPSDPARRAGLRLIDGFTRVIACPHAEAFRRHGDPRRFAEAYVPALRAWSEAVFFDALDESRPIAERRQVVDDLYARYHRRVCDTPRDHRLDYVVCYLLIERAT